MSGFAGLVDDSWLPFLQELEPQLGEIGAKLRSEMAAGFSYQPAGERILRALSLPFDDVRVLVMGQDPYPTPGHAVGLSFSVEPTVRPLPKSLANIFTELASDLQIPKPTVGDLTPWFEQGVLLLNRVLTVRSGAAGSHRDFGWQAITDAAVAALGQRAQPVVAVLWGNDAQQVRPLLGNQPVIASVHPSPLSASRGFFGSKPFSRVNELLVAAGQPPIDWRLP